MTTQAPMQGVFLSGSHDLSQMYGPEIAAVAGREVVLAEPRDIADPARVECALCWQPGPEAFAAYPNLKFVMAVGAGVDALLAHPGLPRDLPVCRVRDPAQAQQMAGYALHEILHVERGFPRMARNAAARVWEEFPIRDPRDVSVAVLGGGSMGRAVAEGVAALGFAVRVASRTAPATPLPGIRHHHGPEGIAQAAEGADFLVNVLPLTPSTENLLDRALFARMARGGWLVQIGRGEHLVEDDLLAALGDGTLAGASLDVMRTEPLPADHPFWARDDLRITPHIASSASARAVAEQLVQSAREARQGLRPALAVDRAAGY